jgi:tetratricopeptide (TPR) repeat protein
LTQPGPRFNPFPGLRPFEADEDHLFFGREREIDELLRRLRTTRFLSVVGTSGSGKSSLIRSGLIPSLYSGGMARAGSGWRIAMLRPGEDPIGHLAAALSPPEILGSAEPELAGTEHVLLEASLRRSTRGLVEAMRLARLRPDDNLLVVVDQFEELFRFRRSRQVENSRDDAIAFVKLLLEAVKQDRFPIYVVLTMRSDFIGDCMEYPGLAEAVNDGQYLVPRMGRDALRSAVTGPVAVGGGRITPRLVLRLLNDIGDDHDQLPVLQHALMRSWDRWVRREEPDQPLDVADYEDIGTLREALSIHAEEAYAETGAGRRRDIAERIFKALTDTFTDPRGVRRPTSVSELCAICEATEAEVIDLVNVFRRSGRSFLTPSGSVPLSGRSIVDLSHESLMRCWDRLMAWANEERAAAAFYARLSQAAEWHAQGTAGFWRDPELELALRWKKETRPTAGWARRFDETFERAMAFLDRSEAARAAERAERQQQRRKKLRQARWTAAVLGVLLIGAVGLAYVAWKANKRAESNFALARDAVDQTLSSVAINPASAGADVPQMAELRHSLLEKAKGFSVEFLNRNPRGTELQKEVGLAHLRLGHISRMLEKPAEAEAEYKEAIRQLDPLERDRPAAESRQALANAYNWLAETLRSVPGRAQEAAQAYEQALRLQSALVAAAPDNAAYRQDLARTHYNRGILRATAGDQINAKPAESEADFRDAIRLLEPLAARSVATAPQELARATNNLASLIADDETRVAEADKLYNRAIEIHEGLLKADPINRQYKLELAQFLENDAERARLVGDFDRATRRNQRALALLDDLLRPAPSLGIEHADAHSLRGMILTSARSPEAIAAYEQSLQLFDDLDRDPAARRLPSFHLRFGDLLLNLAALSREAPADERTRRVLAQAVTHYIAHAEASLAAGDRADAQLVLDNLRRLIPELDEASRRAIDGPYGQLQRRLGQATAK